MQPATISIIGYGTWATALVYLITQNGYTVNWWVRHSEFKKHIFHYQHNPKYLPNIRLCLERINITNLLESVIEGGDLLVFAIPSAYLHPTLAHLKPSLFENKVVVSTIKGLDPHHRSLISQYFFQRFKVSKEQFVVLAGPCHAEEVVQHLPTYITLAAQRVEHSVLLSRFLINENLKIIFSEDIEGVELAGALKNVYAIGAGIALGLGCNDNFISVYVAAAHRELTRLLNKYYPCNREPNSSAYLGDLLVTVFSPHSRNRRLGYWIGEKYTVQEAVNHLQMVAEGYSAAAVITEIFNKADIPIARLIYKVLYHNYEVNFFIEKLKLLLE
ncbi:MAG: NAD(P)-binding domain-containing protein [Bacteroidia bacterium]|nr:NAD(P)-binding domain-containing protein [Bacteroidia bacterium]MDW8158786.1 NAD(P)-binding domain-containing protein [Bacteroidia bacterium]